ncbi:hypothetical protein ACEPAF_18 [Sanghuangporus sanghuang]
MTSDLLDPPLKPKWAEILIENAIESCSQCPDYIERIVQQPRRAEVGDEKTAQNVAFLLASLILLVADIAILADFLKYRVDCGSSSMGGHHLMEHRATSLSNRFRVALHRSSSWITSFTSTISSESIGQSRMHEIFRATIFGALYVGGCKEEFLPIIRDILVVISCFASSSPTTEDVLPFMHLIQKSITLDVLDTTITSLSPILLRDEAVRFRVVLLPAEFLDFISDMQRSAHLWVDVRTSSHKFAQLCLDTMHSDLRFNICGLETASLAGGFDLECRIKASILRILRC